MPTSSDSSKQEEIAQTLSKFLREQYPDSDVNIRILGATVTISRGPPAVQFHVVDEGQFQVSKRMRHTFHMTGGLVGLYWLMQLIQATIGDMPGL